MLIVLGVLMVVMGITSLTLDPSSTKTKDVVGNITFPKFEVARGLEAASFVVPVSIHEQAYIYLTKHKGLSRNHALGLIANGDRESRWVIDATCGSKSGGIFQWYGKRMEKLKKVVPDWATNWKKQLDYALIEDVAPEWIGKNFSTPEEASTWWCKHWERPKNLQRAVVKNNRFIASYSF